MSTKSTSETVIKIITVRVQDMRLSLIADVAQSLGHKPGDRLNAAQAWEAISLNALYMLEAIRDRREEAAKAFPEGEFLTNGEEAK